jgi:pimeloyl-ACP methyl ester carboxylesterase
VPSDPGAPVVLHLLESSGSITSPFWFAGYGSLLADLADLGFASLALDYRGIGASDGSRSVTHLSEDVEAMWSEAVRRAGSPDLVVLRGLSLGALCAGLALQQGAEPAGVALFAPVRSESVVRHFGAHTYGVFGWLAAWVFRPVVEHDLVSELERARVPLLVIAPEDYFLLPEDERASLQRSVAASRGRWVAVDDDHIRAIHDAHGACVAAEIEFLRGLFPGWPDEAARTNALLARLPAELAAACEEDERARARLAVVALSAPRACSGLIAAAAALDVTPERVSRIVAECKSGFLRGKQDRAAEEWIALLDTSDPAGELPYGKLTLFQSPCKVPTGMKLVIGTDYTCVDELVARLGESEAGIGFGAISHAVIVPSDSAGSMQVLDLALVLRELREEHRLGALDARRQVLRMLLKGYGIPERLVRLTGGFGLEAKECGAWRAVDLDWPIPPQRLDEGERAWPTWERRER